MSPYSKINTVNPRDANNWHKIDVTVCICTRNRVCYVVRCLQSLRQQTVGPDNFSILIVDSASLPEVSAELRRLIATMKNIKLVRVDQQGISLARNTAVKCATSDYVAFIDDDAVAAPDWIEQIKRALSEQHPPPAVLGGRTLPIWEAPLPGWWPTSLRGVLTITEWGGSGEYRTADVPSNIGPYGVNMVVERSGLLAIGGFAQSLGRDGERLLSDEDVHVAWMLQDSGRSARHDARIVVSHHIQESRLTPTWLLHRLYWQGISTVTTRRLLGQQWLIWREFPRRLLVALLFGPAALIPKSSVRLLSLRWRQAYSNGFVRAALGWKPGLPVSDGMPIRRTT